MISYLWRWMRLQPATFLLHIGLVVIVIGAFITHFTGIDGRISLHTGDVPTDCYHDSSLKKEGRLPFRVRLDSCGVLYHPGSSAHMDYFSRVSVTDQNGKVIEHGEISMNKVFVHRQWRFCQSGLYGEGSTLTISHDPWGIAVTFTGYALTALAIILYFSKGVLSGVR